MSGHSKWSQIKRQKGAADAKRGSLFTKLTREIMVVVRQGGPNPETNFRLRLAIQKARESNMPADNIKRAIEKASGTGEDSNLTEVTMEGYGPGGVAIMVDATTDNRNRLLQEVRTAFTRHGGSLSESGSVAWLFDTRGTIIVDARGKDASELALNAIDAGAEDVNIGDGYLEVYTAPQNIEAVRKGIEGNDLSITSAEISKVANTIVELDEKNAQQTLRLLDKLEELDDVQRISSNANFSDAVLEKYAQG
jgi:YebC/PmpR family DNA-binding regulatory protein